MVHTVQLLYCRSLLFCEEYWTLFYGPSDPERCQSMIFVTVSFSFIINAFMCLIHDCLADCSSLLLIRRFFCLVRALLSHVFFFFFFFGIFHSVICHCAVEATFSSEEAFIRQSKLLIFIKPVENY